MFRGNQLNCIAQAMTIMPRLVIFVCITLVLTGCRSAPQIKASGQQVSSLLPHPVSTAAIEDSATLSADRKTLIFARRSGQWGAVQLPGTLYETHKTGSHWSRPIPLPFSGDYDDGDPFLSPDGRRLYFTSNRPAANKTGMGQDIWWVERTTAGWGEPQHLGKPVSSAGREYSPVVTADRTLYFASTRRGGFGQGDLYKSQWTGSGYAAAKNLGPVINSPDGEWNVFVSADQQLLIFEASGRHSNQSPAGDLYISYRQRGKWTPPLALTSINTKESELNARLSVDGTVLLFSRSVREPDGGRHADVFTAPAAAALPNPE